MQAKDVMTTNVVTVRPETSVPDIAKLLIEHHVSAVPVVDADNHVLGIVSEADLLHRPEFGMKHRRRSWWLPFLAGRSEEDAADYIKTHGLRAEEVMSRPVTTISEDASLDEIARVLAERRIKRVPVVRDGKLVGIVGRVDLLRGLATRKESQKDLSIDDRTIREQILKTLSEEWAPTTHVNVIVTDGVVHLWGIVQSERERQALRIAAECTPGVRAVEDHLNEVHIGTMAG